MLKSLFEPLIEWYKNSLAADGYPLITFLMAVESSVVPLPSEVVIPPAAHLAHTGQIPLSLWGIVLAGAIGSWLGSTVMYWASRLAGRPLVLRYGKYIFIPHEKVEKAERWSKHYGAMGVFISRVLPVVRHLIGIPMGVVRMNYWLFSLFTFLGSAVWCSVLCYVGVKAGQDPKLLQGELHHVALWVGGIMLALGVLYYFFVHRHMTAKSEVGNQKSK